MAGSTAPEPSEYLENDEGSNAFDGNGRAFPPANADRRDTPFEVSFFQRIQQSNDDAGTRGTDRVTQGTGAAIHIHLVTRKVHLVHESHRDNREGLVHFPQVDVILALTNARQELLRRRDRSRREKAGGLSMTRMTQNPGPNRHALRFGGFCRRKNQRRRAV